MTWYNVNPVVADSHDTLTYYIESGQPIIAASGHDYAINPAAAAPEASTWAMSLIGFAGLAFAGVRSARRRAA